MTDELYADVILIHEKLYRGSAFKPDTLYLYLKFHDNFVIMIKKLVDVHDFLQYVHRNIQDSGEYLLFAKSDELIRLLADYIRENRHGQFGK